MKAKKLPSGSYRVRISLGKCEDGKYHYKSFTADTSEEAEYLAAEYRRSGDRRKRTSKDATTIKDAVEDYVDSHRAVSSPATVRGWNQVRNRYYENINWIPVKDFDTKRAQIFVSSLSADGLSPKSVRNIYGLLLSAVTYHDPDKVLRPVLPQKKRPQLHTPTDAEVKLLLDNAGKELKIAILLAAIGTMRRGEVCGLEYSDIKENFIHVQRVVVKDEDKNWITKSVPKTSESERWIEYPQSVIDLIGTGRGRIIQANPDQISGRFRRLKKKLGIPCRFHDLRHYAASIMHALGVPDQYIMDRGGWRTDTVLKQVYRDVLEDKKNEFTTHANNYLEEKLCHGL